MKEKRGILLIYFIFSALTLTVSPEEQKLTLHFTVAFRDNPQQP